MKLINVHVPVRVLVRVHACVRWCLCVCVIVSVPFVNICGLCGWECLRAHLSASVFLSLSLCKSAWFACLCVSVFVLVCVHACMSVNLG